MLSTTHMHLQIATLPSNIFRHMDSIGKRIQGARRALSKSVPAYRQAAAFARDVGISKEYLFNLESDKVTKPDPNQLVKIARKLSVSVEWLVTGEGIPTRLIVESPELGDVLRACIQLPREQQPTVIDTIQTIMTANNRKK